MNTAAVDLTLPIDLDPICQHWDLLDKQVRSVEELKLTGLKGSLQTSGFQISQRTSEV